MKNINELLDDLLRASESRDAEKIVLPLVEMSKTDINTVVESAVAKIRKTSLMAANGLLLLFQFWQT